MHLFQWSELVDVWNYFSRANNWNLEINKWLFVSLLECDSGQWVWDLGHLLLTALFFHTSVNK